MAEYQGFTFETPQEILARVKTQRTAMVASNNPLLIQQSIFGNALDSLFGNPEARQQQKTLDRVGAAMKTVPEGKTSLETETLRLKAVLGAVGDSDPKLGDQIRAKLVQLESEQVERDKLSADQSRAASAEARAAELQPLTVGQAKLNKRQDENASDTWHKGASKLEVLQSDSDKQSSLAKLGWVKEKPSTEAEGESIYKLTKPVQTDLENMLIAADRTLEDMGSVAANYDPSFTTIPVKVKQAFVAGVEMVLPGAINAPTQEKLAKYTRWRSGTLDGLNRYIKDITGASMSLQETVRIEKSMPSEKDSDTEYINKSRRVVQQALQARARAQFFLQNGIPLTKDSFDKNPLTKFARVDEKTVDMTMQQMFGTTGIRGEVAAAAPATEGWGAVVVK